MRGGGLVPLLECPLEISLAPAFAADFPPDAHKFIQRTLHVRLINLCTPDKKSSHKIKHKETPREHLILCFDYRCYEIVQGFYHFRVVNYKMNRWSFFFRKEHVFIFKNMYLYISKYLRTFFLKCVVWMFFSKFSG